MRKTLRLIEQSGKVLSRMRYVVRTADQWREQPPKALERNLEAYCDKYAKEVYGCKSRKMNGMGFADWPDRVYLTKSGKTLWIEFKRFGEGPTPNQAELHKWMREHGHTVKVVDRVKTFAQFFEQEIGQEIKAPKKLGKARRAA